MGLISKIIRVGAILISLLFAGCQTISPGNVSKFGQGVTQTQQQVDAAFHNTNSLAQEQSISYVISTQNKLKEEDFSPALEADAVKAWDDAFSVIENYASLLTKLLSNGQSNQFGEAAVALGSQINSINPGHSISKPLETAFTQFGKILIDIKNEHDAQQAMRKVDPAIRETFTIMAHDIGENNKHGIQGTVWSNWTDKIKNGPVHDYAQAVQKGNNAGKRTSAENFVKMLANRDAQLSSLAALRRSILALADAHTAVAKGSSIDVANFLSIINDQLTQTQLVLSRFKTVDVTTPNTKK